MKTNALRAYIKVSLFMIRCAEREGVPIAPLLGKSRQIELESYIYSELLDNRVFRIAIYPNTLGSPFEGFCHWISDVGEEFEIEALTIDLKGLPSEMAFLWNIRKSWLLEKISRRGAEALLDAAAQKVAR